MMMKSIHSGPVLLLLVWFFLAASPTHAQQEARLSDIVVTHTAEDLIVYFTVEDCFTGDMIEAIESGLPTTFTFYVRLYERRGFWWDRLMEEVEVRHTVRFDQLKKHYELTLSDEGREVKNVQDFDEVRRLMSEVIALPVVSLERLHKGGRYQLQVMAEMDKIRLPLYLHYVLFFLSLWDFETDWYTVNFLF